PFFGGDDQPQPVSTLERLFAGNRNLVPEVRFRFAGASFFEIGSDRCARVQELSARFARHARPFEQRLAEIDRAAAEKKRSLANIVGCFHGEARVHCMCHWESLAFQSSAQQIKRMLRTRSPLAFSS